MWTRSLRPISGSGILIDDPPDGSRWHPGHVGLLFRLVEFLIVVVPLVGIIIAAVRGFSANKRPGETITLVAIGPGTAAIKPPSGGR